MSEAQASSPPDAKRLRTADGTSAAAAKQNDEATPTVAEVKEHMKSVLDTLTNRNNLDAATTAKTVDLIARGLVDPIQLSAFLVLLRSKGETAEEVTALVRVMRSHMVPAGVPEPDGLLDIVGTGGDGHHTVNFSTAAAVVAAACGVRVAKHGNRSVSSKSGSADVLESLGVVMLSPEHVAPCIANAGIAFMFAPKFHPAMRHVVPVRRGLGVRTVFNILGPLLNPAGARRLMLGVYHPDLLQLYGETVLALGAKHALIVHCCGLDELAPLGTADAVEVTPEHGVVRIKINCTDAMGLEPCTIADLKGGSCEENAAILRSLFSGGTAAEGPVAQTVALNAGAGLYVAGVASSIKDGFDRCMDVLRSGKVINTLDTWASQTQNLDPTGAAALKTR